jgi:hypothetical protein
MHTPHFTHIDLVKRSVHYIIGTLNYDKHIVPSQTSSLVAFSDAYWAVPDTRQPTTGLFSR